MLEESAAVWISHDEAVNGAVRSAASRKRRYQRLMPWQKQLLAKHFLSGDFWPSRETREALAQQLGIDQRKVQIWFQNERAKCSISIRTPLGELSRTASPSSGEFSGDEHDSEEVKESMTMSMGMY